MFIFAQSLPGYYEETRSQLADEQLHFLFLIINNLINKQRKPENKWKNISTIYQSLGKFLNEIYNKE